MSKMMIVGIYLCCAFCVWCGQRVNWLAQPGGVRCGLKFREFCFRGFVPVANDNRGCGCYVFKRRRSVRWKNNDISIGLVSITKGIENKRFKIWKSI